LILVLVVGVTLSFFWILLTPRWSFTIATNKAVYAIGEEVQITATLKNTGYIPQTITSGFTSLVIVWVERLPDDVQVWYAPSHVQTNQTTFMIDPEQSLTRTFIWNGSWVNQVRYSFKAAIPSANAVRMSDVDTEEGRQFYAQIEINIISD